MSEKVLVARNPGEVRLIGICDPHLSAVNPVAYKVDYWEETKAVIGQVLNFAEINKIDAVVWAGDIFNLKSPARNPHWFVAEVMRILQSSSVIHIGIAGNHDMKYGSLVGLEGQPLDVLRAAGIYHLLDDADVRIDGGLLSVRIAGASYEHGYAEKNIAHKKQGADFLLSVGHFWFGKVSGVFFNEPVVGPDRLSLGEADAYLIGHHHEDQGVQVIDGKTYIVHGSINRTGMHKNDRTRRPAASYIRINPGGCDVQVLRPKVKTLEEIMDVVVREAVLQERQEMDAFIASLGTTSLKPLDPKDVLQEMELTTEVRERVERYLQEAEVAE